MWVVLHSQYLLFIHFYILMIIGFSGDDVVREAVEFKWFSTDSVNTEKKTSWYSL